MLQLLSKAFEQGMIFKLHKGFVLLSRNTLEAAT